MANRELDAKAAARIERHHETLRASAEMKRAQQRHLTRFRLEEEAGKAPWRGQHRELGGAGSAVGEVEQLHGEARDHGGRTPIIGSARRCRDTLAELLKRGAISAAEEEAGRRFQAEFHRAGLQPLRAADLLRAPGGAGGRGGAGGAGVALERAVAALGGRDSPLAVLAWEVLGCGQSLREAALGRHLRNGARLDEKVAKGLLVGALVVLSVNYRLAR